MLSVVFPLFRHVIFFGFRFLLLSHEVLYFFSCVRGDLDGQSRLHVFFFPPFHCSFSFHVTAVVVLFFFQFRLSSVLGIFGVFYLIGASSAVSDGCVHPVYIPVLCKVSQVGQITDRYIIQILACRCQRLCRICTVQIQPKKRAPKSCGLYGSHPAT